MKIAFIGVRGHYNYAVNGLADNKEDQVVGVAKAIEQDDLAKIMGSIAKIGQSPREFNDWRKMLDDTRPDVVVVSGPLYRHAEILIEVFARGISAFCEKPIAITLEDFAKVKRAFADSKSNLAAQMGIRYEPAFLTAWKAVRAGAIGQPRILDGRKSYKCGKRDEFYRKRATYGGTIPWVGSHAIDWVQWFSGQKFKSVYAAHTAHANRDHGEMEMTSMCIFEMTDDVMATVSMDYLRPDNAPTHGDDRIRCAGTEGVIEVRGGQAYLINGAAKGEQVLELSADRQIFRDFMAQCKGTGKCLV
ncbi:MAG TPA: Gfo/Idh/MocA family oxidoreductase, partial [Sedimentisphaerales bacterium]|nr:Gfo/Idh/MocA family oxidoreductase [Sedimentisphaerales bacterium]